MSRGGDDRAACRRSARMRALACVVLQGLLVIAPRPGEAAPQEGQPAGQGAEAAPDGEASAPREVAATRGALDDSKKARADAHLDKGFALYDAGAWDAALAEFLEARRVYASRSATYNAGVCLERLRRYDEALDMFEMLLREFAAVMSGSEKERAQRKVTALRGLVGTLEVEGAEPGAALVIDWQDRGELPSLAPLRVVAGSHLVRVSKEGFEPLEKRVEVAGGQSVRIDVRMRALARSGRLRVIEQHGRALDVVIDGGVVGKTPWEGRLAVGDHVVLLRGEGSLGTPPVSVPVQLNLTTPLTLAAEELTARIQVLPVPRNASVAVDAIVVGRGVWEGQLRAGRHKIEVVADGFLPAARDVTLVRGGRESVTIALQRDPRSPFWRKPPRPPRLVLEASGAVPIIPTFGDDIAGGCAGGCSAPPGVGAAATLRGGYELSSGLGFGLTMGYFFVSQSVKSRAAAIQPVGFDGEDRGIIDDTLAIRRGLLTGAWIGYSLGERFPARVRLGAGLLLASVTDTRVGTFKLGEPLDYAVGPISVVGFTPFFHASPELRAGFRVNGHVELSLGVEALCLIALSRPTWGARREINAGSSGIGTFADERLIGRIVFVVLPSVGARYEF